VAKPVREAGAVARRAGCVFDVRVRETSTVDHITQDEEMFI